jgi:co-chaperonin GroES (HSP10)
MKASTVNPIRRRVIVKLDGAIETRTAAGLIVIPAVSHQQIYQGVVVRVAADCLDVKVGDAVILNRMCANALGRTPVALDDEDEINPANFVMLAETDILCVLEPAA